MGPGRNVLINVLIIINYDPSLPKRIKGLALRNLFKQWKPSPDGVKHLNKLFKT